MKIKLQILDENSTPWFLGNRDLPGEGIIDLALKRKPLLEEKGAAFIQGTIPHFANEVAVALREGQSEDEIDRRVIELAVATVTVDLTHGISQEVLTDALLDLKLHKNGVVEYTHR